MRARFEEWISSAGRLVAPVVGVVTGSGQVAQSAVEAGADFLLVLNSGLYRSQGAGSLASFLPYGNANRQTLELLTTHVLPRAHDVPVVAGVLASDPEIDLGEHLATLKGLGVAGVTNWPAVDFVDGRYREALEAEGLGSGPEVGLVRAARAAGLLAFGFTLRPDLAARFAEAGAEGLILNLGLTRPVEGVVERRDQLQQAIVRLNAMLRAATRSGRRPLCVAYGGPIAGQEDLEQLLLHAPVDGFAGGSVFERLPVHQAIASAVGRFKGVVRQVSAEDRAAGPLVGRGPAMRRLLCLIDRVAPYDVSVCIEGETGSGKELVATQIHQRSPRAHRPFVTVNCGAIPETLLESELFGHEKGAFTGADRMRLGKFDVADGGSLFLDEVADLSPHGQVALLRALQQREITRVGASAPRAIDVRVIAASNQPLEELVAAGRFRADLYYRLNQFLLTVPPLRERAEDLPLLAEHILEGLRHRLRRPIAGTSRRFLAKLARHGWPGNVRELQHVLCQAALLEDGEVLEGTHFTLGPSPGPRRAGESPGPARSRHQIARDALDRAGGNKSRAAEALGITRKTLYAWLASEGDFERS
jgi:DNA-binding NtrC family response regulator/predicted TIM-barrel enzyme